MHTLTIATRGSKLALWQAEYIRSHLLAVCPELDGVDLLVLKTTGDRILNKSLASMGGKGLFVKEIEEALLDGRADLAVHSIKDMPMILPGGLILGAIPQREDPRDAFVSARWPDLESLPHAAVVGTCSLRRQAQVLALRPDLTIRPLRGNVDTRLRKLLEGKFDAVVLASAGLNRLNLNAPHVTPLSVTDCLPAAGQGALGIEFAAQREDLVRLTASLEHFPTRVCVEAERGLLAGLDGDCQIPVAAYAVMTGPDGFFLNALIMDCQGKCVVRAARSGDAATARQCGMDLAGELKAGGGAELLASLRTARRDYISF